jgi:hypothetical protein
MSTKLEVIYLCEVSDLLKSDIGRQYGMTFFDNVHNFKDKHEVQVQPALLYDRKPVAQKQIWNTLNEDLESMMLPGKTGCQTD